MSNCSDRVGRYSRSSNVSVNNRLTQLSSKYRLIRYIWLQCFDPLLGHHGAYIITLKVKYMFRLFVPKGIPLDTNNLNMYYTFKVIILYGPNDDPVKGRNIVAKYI
jgi:hypothetical protein